MIWLFFLLKPGFGHETFSIIKLFGFVLIVMGVLFFNKILVIEGYGIRYTGNDPPETKPADTKKNSSEEEFKFTA